MISVCSRVCCAPVLIRLIVCAVKNTARAVNNMRLRRVNASYGAWKKLTKIITRQGGEVQQDDGSYLHATFTSPVFRYVDDVELRLDEDHGLIHIRSASRVGRSDFGVNRKRIERIIQAL